jgi:hypothetical protein
MGEMAEEEMNLMFHGIMEGLRLMQEFGRVADERFIGKCIA